MNRKKAFRTLVPALLTLGFGFALMAPIIQRNPDWFQLILPGGRRLGLLTRSLLLSGAASLVDLALGVVIASAMWTWSIKRQWLRWLPLVMGVLPPYIHALAWTDLLQLFSLRFSGELAAFWVMSMAYLPASIGLALLSLETVERASVDAARVWRKDLAVLMGVVLPLAGPLLAAEGVLLTLLNLMDYSVPSLFGVNVYSLEIFAEYSATGQPARAFLMSIPLIAVSVGLLPVMRSVTRFAGQVLSTGGSPWRTSPVWPAGFIALQWGGLGIWILQIGAPLISLFHLALPQTMDHSLLISALPDLRFSLGVALSAALLSLPLSWVGMEAAHHWRGISGLLILPLVLPAPFIGTALVALFNQPGLAGIYNSAGMPVLAGLLRFVPLGVLAIMAQARRVDPLLFDAARVFQSRPGQAALWVRLPLLAPGLVAASCLVFALTLGELGATLIVIPPGYSTLSLRIYNYLHYGASDVVAQLCLVVLALVFAASLIAALVLARARQSSTTEGV